MQKTWPSLEYHLPLFDFCQISARIYSCWQVIFVVVIHVWFGSLSTTDTLKIPTALCSLWLLEHQKPWDQHRNQKLHNKSKQVFSPQVFSLNTPPVNKRNKMGSFRVDLKAYLYCQWKTWPRKELHQHMTVKSLGILEANVGVKILGTTQACYSQCQRGSLMIVLCSITNTAGQQSSTVTSRLAAVSGWNKVPHLCLCGWS